MCFSPCYQPDKTLKHGRKCQEDVPKSNFNTYVVSNLSSGKLDDLAKRETTTHMKAVRPNIPLGQRRKCVVSTVSGSVGLHECSTIDKQQNITSKHCERTLERNQLSCDSVSLKDSLVEKHVSTCKSKRVAALLMENAVTSCKSTVHPSKCPRTNLKDTPGSKVCRKFIQMLKVEHYIIFFDVVYSGVSDIDG